MLEKKRTVAVGIVVLLLMGVVIACGGPSSGDGGDVTSSAQEVTVPGGAEQETVERPPPPPGARSAPELQDISGWINSEPLSLEDLRGKVVLIDFWTYTCVNCIRTMPYLKQWYEKYANKGLVIIGVHTPEFDFEKNRKNVEEAIAKFGLRYPVAQDNDYGTWEAFENRFWPAKYLIDQHGYIRYQHFGEGAYDETEMKIRELLQERGTSLEGVSLNPDSGPAIDAQARSDDLEFTLTRELYGGYQRNFSFRGQYVAQERYYDGQNVIRDYEDPGEHRNHFIYLQGQWLNGPESLAHGRDTGGYEDYIAIKFFATSVNVVLRGDEGVSYKVWVTLDGENLNGSNKGADVTFDEEGRSVVIVDKPLMYQLVELEEIGSHELKLSSNSDQFSLFAYTFGAYSEGP